MFNIRKRHWQLEGVSKGLSYKLKEAGCYDNGYCGRWKYTWADASDTKIVSADVDFSLCCIFLNIDIELQFVT